MSINEANVRTGADQMANSLDKATTQQQAEQVADRLRADFVDCMSQGTDGVERWNQIVANMNYSDKKGTGWDVQVKNNSDGLPSLTLVDSSKGFEIGGSRYLAPSLVINEDHSGRKGFTPHAESAATPRKVLPIEMR
ncbi:MAG TPA: hypothetical protein EYN91_00425 [Candidatus Melainabacteria bacterium]|jgi:hypothetical protein|nr:hypothetical protein [Candidatus Melainabacteria bacterium]HIN65877.1 hypothetical protein [Candidatus Obscuribacterales bacterium]